MTLVSFSKALSGAAKNLGIHAPDIGTSKGKAYEAWVMLEIVVRLSKHGVHCVPEDHKDEWEPVFRVSGAPANMPSAQSADPNEPCHFTLWKDGAWLELHLGLKMLGFSETTHEIDISVIDGPAARRLRQLSGGPYANLIVAGAELKAYDRKHKLSHVVPRALLGIAIDINPTWIMGSFAVKTAAGKERPLVPVHRTFYSVMTSTQLHDTSVKYLEHHGAGGFSNVDPSNCNEAMDAFVSVVLDAMDR